MITDINRNVPIIFQKLHKFESEQTDIRFQSVKIWLMHLEENFNGSYFSRSAVEAALPTLANTPILAYIENNDYGEMDFSDHRDVLIKKDGKTTTKYLGKAIGVIPQDNNAQFEERLCDDGITRTFLTVEGLLWTKFDDPIDIMNRDHVKAQSMELASDYDGEFKDDGLFHFTKFSFYGACGLGINVSPAMKNATIELQFSHDKFQQEVNKNIELFKEVFKEYKNIDFKEDELVVKTKKDIATQFNLTTNQLYDEIERVLSTSKYTTTNWWDEEVELNRYYLKDFDDGYIYAKDRMKDYIDVKLPYSMNGDNVVIDFENQKRIKYVPTDWEEENDIEIEIENYALILEKEFKESANNNKEKYQKLIDEKNDAYLELNEKFSKVETELLDATSTIANKDETIANLQQFKKQIEDTQRKEKVEEVFTKFAAVLTKDEMDDFRKKESTFEQFSDFEREIKSYACDKLMTNNKNTTEFSRISIPAQNENDNVQSNNVWDRLSNKK